mgnify:CR=1 FL=1
MKKQFTILLILVSCLSAFSQELIVEVKSDTTPLPFVDVFLINQNTADTLLTQTDFNGLAHFKEISSSTYKLKAYYPQHKFNEINSLEIKDSSQHKLKLNSKPCRYDYEIKNCPRGNSKKKVIRVLNGMVVSLNFGNNERRAKKYYKKIAKQGFETTHLDEGEFLITVFDSDLDSVFKSTDVCDRYLFCKKHKIFFK